MANVKITELTALTNPASSDVLPIVDVGADETKKVTIADLLENAGDGSTANPAFSFNNDKNTGIYRPGADQFAISTGGSEAARIDSDGRVLVGLSTLASGGDAAAENASFVVQGRIGSTIDGGRANFQRASVPSAANASLGDIYFTDSSNNCYVKISAQSDGTTGAGAYPGRLVFFVTADGSASPTEALRITNDRYVRLASGSGGIQFNGDTAAANALDDYEEGTWTPLLLNSGGTQMSTSSVAGRYIKIGSQVTCWGSITATSGISGTLDPYMLVRGLPFPVGATSPTPSPVGIGSAAQSISGTEFKPMFARASTEFGQTQIFMYRGETAFTGGTGFKVVLSYRTID